MKITEYPRLCSTDAILVLNVQRDFCPGGKIAVPDGERVVGVLNTWMHEAKQRKAVILAARDWHAPNHVSFVNQGGTWPPHCVWGTSGADFHPRLEFPSGTVRLWLGVTADHDPESAFDDTGLAEFLERRRVRRVFIGGLAMEHCVRSTVLEALQRGIQAHLIVSATLPLDPNSLETALGELEQMGAVLVIREAA